MENDGNPTTFSNDGGSTNLYMTGTSGTQTNQWHLNAGQSGNMTYQTGLRANLANATAVTINALRQASAIQRFMENRARWGSRYAEYVRHAFGARPLDARLQRPEFLAGGAQRISMSEVLQTAPDPQAGQRQFGVGDLYGHGIGVTRSNRYRVAFQEHGYVISLVSVRPKAMYTNGIARSFLRSNKEDFYQPELAHIGQQQVRTAEVYATPANQADFFGWSDRYQEYRYQRSEVHGDFRDTLDYWHLGRKFTDAPALNQSFVQCDAAETKRIFNEQTANSCWVATQHNLQALRVVTRDATPRLL